MLRTKLIGLLRQLDKKEMNRLGHFLESPFFFGGRREQKLIDFYQYLRRFHPHFENKKLTKEKAYARLFPDRPYNENQLQQLMTKFNKVLERFIVEIYQSQTFGFPSPSHGLAAFYREKNMITAFEKWHRQAIHRQAQTVRKDPYHYWIDFLLAKELTEVQSLYNIRKSDLNLPATLSRLDYFFLAVKLEAACVWLNQHKHQVAIAADGALETLDALMPLLDAGYFREEPLIELFYRAYHLLQEEATAADFDALQRVYDERAMEIGFNQRQIIHGVLRIFCTSRYNAGESEYLAPLFNLYQVGLEQGVLTYGEGLLPATFQTIVTLGLKSDQLDWVEAFLEKYRHRLVRTEDTGSIYTLKRANLLFARGHYEAAQACLTYEFADIYLKLVARRLEVQIYYELESDLLDAKIQAFKVFIFRVSRSRLPDLQREGYNNFIDLLKQIIHPSTRYNDGRRTMLLDKIRGKKTVAERQWLLAKLRD